MKTNKSSKLALLRRLGAAAFLQPLSSLSVAALALALGSSSAQAVNVGVDGTKTWLGFMNVSELPANGGAYDFSSVWATADLNATFSGSTLTLTPNTSIDQTNPNDPYWWVGGAGGDPNKNMDALMYVQDDSLAGQFVTFAGTCVTNTLNYPYTCVAYVKDLDANFNTVTVFTVPLSSGTSFSVGIPTNPGDHVQYGFETVGPDARLTNVANLGLVQVAVPSSTHVYVDQSKNWIGYMNVFELPANGGAYDFGSAWGTGDLDATFSAGVVTLTPNDSIYRTTQQSDTFWWQPDGTGNKSMDANFYVENSSLAGQIVTFSGFVWTNTLVAPYTSQAFIKELDANAGYATVNIVTTNLTGTNFSISTPTTVGHVVQYGFETVGPNANTALTPLASLGQVLVASNALPTGPVITALPATTYVNVGSNVSITVTATGSGLTYQWKKNGVNLSNGAGVSGATTATLTLSSVTGAAEAGYSVVVSDSAHRTTTGNSFVVVFDPNKLSFDPNATLNGYINAWFNTGGTQGGYSTGFGYPIGQLRAGVSGGVAYMQPNIDLYQPNNAFWVNPDGTPAQFVEEDFFIANDALAGVPLTLVGYCPSNSLDASYTATAWIEDFVPNYGSLTAVTTNLVAGQPFSITLPTVAGDHIQYGLRVFGLDNAPTNSITQGAVLVTVIPPTLSASRVGGATQVSFNTVSGHNYTVQYKNNLTDSSWTAVSNGTVSGTGSVVTVSDTTAQAHRFYRLSIQ